MKTRNIREQIDNLGGHNKSKLSQFNKDLKEILHGLAYTIDDLKNKYVEYIDLDKAEELKGVDDSEEVELSDWDLRTLIALVKDNALYYGNSHDALESKLNKMLKEKE